MDPIIDTHAHICDAEFDADREQVLKRARVLGSGSLDEKGFTCRRSAVPSRRLKAMPTLVPSAAARNASF